MSKLKLSFLLFASAFVMQSAYADTSVPAQGIALPYLYGAGLFTPSPSPLPPDTTSGTTYPFGFVEAGGDYNWFTTTPDPNGRGGYFTGSVTTSAINTWGLTFDHQNEFNTEDSFFVVNNTHTYNEQWYSNVYLAASGSGFIYPWYEADVFLSKKWLSDLSLITTLGYDRYYYENASYTNNGFFGLAYYFPCNWVVEGGINVFQNQPGSLGGENQFFAITEGSEKHHYYVLRYSFGREAYQTSDEVTTNNVGFPYQEVSLTWRQWVGDTWGFNIRGTFFKSSPESYNETGVWVGLFKTF